MPKFTPLLAASTVLSFCLILAACDNNTPEEPPAEEADQAVDESPQPEDESPEPQEEEATDDDQAEEEEEEESPARFESFELSLGFEPDPIKATGEAGGPRDAGALSKGCEGNIAEADEPDHVLTLTQHFPYLRMRVYSQPPTSLVILDPQGHYHCAGDQETIANRFDAGEYRVFVGAPGDTNPVYQLEITEEFQEASER